MVVTNGSKIRRSISGGMPGFEIETRVCVGTVVTVIKWARF